MPHSRQSVVVSWCLLLLAIIFLCRPQNSRTHCVYIPNPVREQAGFGRKWWAKQLLPPQQSVLLLSVYVFFDDHYKKRSVCPTIGGCTDMQCHILCSKCKWHSSNLECQSQQYWVPLNSFRARERQFSMACSKRRKQKQSLQQTALSISTVNLLWRCSRSTGVGS